MNENQSYLKSHKQTGNGAIIAIVLIAVIAVGLVMMFGVSTSTTTVQGPIVTKSGDDSTNTPAPKDDTPAPKDVTPAPKDDKPTNGTDTPKPTPPADDKIVMAVELPQPVFTGTPKKIPPNVRINKKTYGKPRGEFHVPKGSAVISRDKPVTASSEPFIGDLEQVTDGDKEGIDNSWIEFDSGKQFITIDLEAEYHLDAIIMWHHHGEPRFYRDVIVEVADDADFTKNVRIVFNNDFDNSYGKGQGMDYEYVEAREGRLVDPKGVKARYIRLHSNGSTADDQNHYTEVEVWGRAAK